MTRFNRQGVPLRALLVSMLGIVAAILVQLGTTNAYLYIINASLVGGMIAWLVSLLAHVRFRQRMPAEQLAQLELRSPLGAAGSIAGFIAVIAAVACTWWVTAIERRGQERGVLYLGAERGLLDSAEKALGRSP